MALQEESVAEETSAHSHFNSPGQKKVGASSHMVQKRKPLGDLLCAYDLEIETQK